jgi:hypothetical protein
VDTAVAQLVLQDLLDAAAGLQKVADVLSFDAFCTCHDNVQDSYHLPHVTAGGQVM